MDALRKAIEINHFLLRQWSSFKIGALAPSCYIILCLKKANLACLEKRALKSTSVELQSCPCLVWQLHVRLVCHDPHAGVGEALDAGAAQRRAGRTRDHAPEKEREGGGNSLVYRLIKD